MVFKDVVWSWLIAGSLVLTLEEVGILSPADEGCFVEIMSEMKGICVNCCGVLVDSDGI
jgi:hypothetical protein